MLCVCLLSNSCTRGPCRVLTPRKQGGLGDMKVPMLADKTGEISRAYGVYKEDEGVAFRLSQTLATDP